MPLKEVNRFYKRLKLKNDASLRVLIYHDTAPSDKKNFYDQLKWLSRGWRFVSPDVFAAMILGKEKIAGRNLLVTFDDGFSCNLEVAQEILQPLGVKALFFVTTNFVGLDDLEKERTFMAQNIWPGIDPGLIKPHLRSLKWSDLEKLLDMGHSIGAHTRNHRRLSELNDPDELIDEINGSGDVLESRLGVKINHFAFPFGNLQSFSPLALKIARKRFPFIYSGLRGENCGGVPSWAIRRDHVALSDSTSVIETFLEGGADFYYWKSRKTLDNWGKEQDLD